MPLENIIEVCKMIKTMKQDKYEFAHQVLVIRARW